MSDTEEKDKKKDNTWCIVMFILNVIVLANTSHQHFIEVFSENGENYYIYNQIATWSTLGLWILTIIVSCGMIASRVSDNDGIEIFGGLCGSVLVFATVGILVTSIIYMGIIWNNDPDHTLPFYNKFWTEGATAFPNNNLVVNSTLHRRLVNTFRPIPV